MKSSILLRMARRAQIPLAVASLALLASCGGGGGGGSSSAAPAPAAAVSTSVPQSAYASINAFVGYLNTMAVSETGNPLDTGNGTPPVSDSATPTAIN